ncbi:hypothetical protein PR202_ga02137 [Eleusine coracana subsp. coracana]|uniref:Glycosyl transferase CAP10 domain-containing protein n=1 Tax=Eleusine coracana subsp. coracana TaxID=191504 RepID=A0AAV5BH26_ELECO|nr:hypothetical protein PR202_ga01450 [Eleusine coracana subsp. coracana]GJM86292.1 hypothetical protein PR202_ga02137 [Eleusine coracana subsp. coracana]
MATAAAAAVPDGRRWSKAAGSASSPVTTAIFLFFFFVVIGVLVSARWITTTVSAKFVPVSDRSSLRHSSVNHQSGSVANKAGRHKLVNFQPLISFVFLQAILITTQTTSIPAVPTAPPPPRPTYTISCSAAPLPRDPTIPSNISQTLTLALSPNNTFTCSSVPDPPPLPATPPPGANASSCPSYFRYIHEDLHPWRVAGGITRAMVDRARATANFRLVVVRGRAYVEHIAPAFQTRDLFTIWGILQLFRRYPGRVPDLDLMFDCVDWPVVRAEQYEGENATVLPPLFRYCGDNETLDVVFPDWSFWGWPEINIKPWHALQKELNSGNKRVKWLNREPYAYWKGNPDVAAIRQELVKCNVSSTQEWNARIYKQDWLKEIKAGYKQSDLASQCSHRYKIYIEGSAWSVSEKYILACDSMTLVVTPKYYDFYSRVLMPMRHYWPVRDEEKCSSIKHAVDWGNSHKQKVQANIPQEAVEVCPESLACQAVGREKKFMEDSMVRSANDAGPCDLPPPFNPEEFKALQRRREKSMKQIEAWEQKASKPVDSKP